jgi:2,4-dienoyl-CoA reductase-like NADH-dependent reductase (Old Yellow Enzyme family)
MLFDKCTLKGRELKNHIVFPPVVCFGWGIDGKLSQKHIDHYKAVAQGGAALIITEAACIRPDARLADSQPGIWSDDFIAGFSAIAQNCHANGVTVLSQIHHAGIKSVTGEPKVPSAGIIEAGVQKTLNARELSIAEIKQIEDEFAAAALRIKKAGIDGIELHGAHGFLLSYFLSSNTNRRSDQYGGSPENRARLVTDIIKRIRKECGEDFIIGIRCGGASPSLEDGIANAKLFEKAGCDILHISFGASINDAASVPVEYTAFEPPVYAATEIKKQVSIPVIASKSVGSLENGQRLIDNGLVDFVSYARNILADYDWPRKMEQGQNVNECLKCKRCMWHTEALKNCPARKKLNS